MMLQEWLVELNHETVGPAYSLDGALSLIQNACPDAALLDLAVRDQSSYPVAAVLQARGVRFAFATGLGDQSRLDAAFKDTPVVSKPFDFMAIKNVLAKLTDPESVSASPTPTDVQAQFSAPR
jgi:hypothetical protein